MVYRVDEEGREWCFISLVFEVKERMLVKFIKKTEDYSGDLTKSAIYFDARGEKKISSNLRFKFFAELFRGKKMAADFYKQPLKDNRRFSCRLREE